MNVSFRDKVVWVLGVFFLTSTVFVPLAAGAQDSQRPNIVFLLADDLGFTDIAPYGSEGVFTSLP